MINNIENLYYIYENLKKENKISDFNLKLIINTCLNKNISEEKQKISLLILNSINKDTIINNSVHDNEYLKDCLKIFLNENSLKLKTRIRGKIND